VALFATWTQPAWVQLIKIGQIKMTTWDREDEDLYHLVEWKLAYQSLYSPLGIRDHSMLMTLNSRECL